MKASGGSPGILIVDDQETNLTVLRLLLGDLGYTLITADSGAAALRCLLDHDFSLIILDVRLLDMDGFDLAALIRQRDCCRGTPILFLTAHSGIEIPPFEGRDFGPVDLIEKPAEGAVLRARVLEIAALGAGIPRSSTAAGR